MPLALSFSTRQPSRRAVRRRTSPRSSQRVGAHGICCWMSSVRYQAIRVFLSNFSVTMTATSMPKTYSRGSLTYLLRFIRSNFHETLLINFAAQGVYTDYYGEPSQL